MPTLTAENTATAINLRYSDLAKESCCLSCGGAIKYIEPNNGDVCVDLGSGRGNDTIRMAQMTPNGKAYGIDLSDGMIAKAKAQAEKLEIKNVEFIQSELTTLPLPSGTIDWLTSNCTLNHVTDKIAVWGEIYRVLKSGATVVVSDIFSLSLVPKEYANDPTAVSECWAGAITKLEYLSILKKSGFLDIKILEESKPYQKGKIEVCSFTFLLRKV